MAQGMYFDDLSPGEVRRSARSIVMDRDSIIGFARQFDPHPGHIGEETAGSSSFGELVASGWHTAGVATRLITETMPIEGGGFGGSVEVRWLKPVRPGDALRIEIEVLTLRPSASRPNLGIITMRTTVLNQSDETVATLLSTNLLPRRPHG
jgi:acyl dehydratase